MFQNSNAIRVTASLLLGAPSLWLQYLWSNESSDSRVLSGGGGGGGGGEQGRKSWSNNSKKQELCVLIVEFQLTFCDFWGETEPLMHLLASMQINP